jgi:transcriptional regulator of arginine metabolism
MKGKLERHRIIREVLMAGRIASQEELASVLAERGVDVAQATLSRDIKELRMSKLHDENGYYYSLPRQDASPEASVASVDAPDSILSIEFSGPITVIKTRPGHANMVASVIDSNHLAAAAGTIAGDDTIFIIVREGFDKEDLLHSLGKLFKRLDSKRLN